MPRKRQAFHTPAVSQLASGLAVMLTTVDASSLASFALAETAIGPIVVGTYRSFNNSLNLPG